MEIWQSMRDATESARGIDVVIEDLDEFAVGRPAFCQLTNADYVTQVMAPVVVG
jgi:hypothetical protein